MTRIPDIKLRKNIRKQGISVMKTKKKVRPLREKRQAHARRPLTTSHTLARTPSTSLVIPVILTELWFHRLIYILR